ncbi:MAG: tRNA 2-thiouridine(34) synthase MnmA, partial [Bacteroidales bacterium]|nr:tRNA 2-thiouridine(34) synthase MnmA [Bacteroidales bacterium]
YMLKDTQLKKSLFPVGKLTKDEVREIAKVNALPVSNKKDSTGICFIGERNFKTFLQNYLPATPGIMRTEKGEVLGEHIGLMHYTLGQRKGLGIGGHGDGRSYFVAEKDLNNNELILVQGPDHPLLYSNSAKIEELTWIKEAPCEKDVEINLMAKFRYRQPDQAVTIVHQGDIATVRFDVPQRAITPGQSAVFYQGEMCIGGGIIQSFKRDS